MTSSTTTSGCSRAAALDPAEPVADRPRRASPRRTAGARSPGRSPARPRRRGPSCRPRAGRGRHAVSVAQLAGARAHRRGCAMAPKRGTAAARMIGPTMSSSSRCRRPPGPTQPGTRPCRPPPSAPATSAASVASRAGGRRADRVAPGRASASCSPPAPPSSSPASSRSSRSTRASSSRQAATRRPARRSRSCKALRRLSTELSGAQVGITADDDPARLHDAARRRPAAAASRSRRRCSADGASAASSPACWRSSWSTASRCSFGELVPKNFALSRPLRHRARRSRRCSAGSPRALRPLIVGAQRQRQRAAAPRRASSRARSSPAGARRRSSPRWCGARREVGTLDAVDRDAAHQLDRVRRRSPRST